MIEFDDLSIKGELDEFIKVANTNEQYNYNHTPIVPNSKEQHNLDHRGKINNSPSTESFGTNLMNCAWMVCYATTTIILLFLVFLWFYFESIRR